MQRLANDSFLFTGQYFDSEIEEYYLRARQYNPHLARFNSRDPFAGKFKKPLTLQKYLYCQNNPVDSIDPSGRWAVLGIPVGGSYMASALVARSETAATFYGVEDGTYNVFFGMITYKSTGVNTGIGASVGFSVGFSENAQCPQDLAGPYREVGASFSL